MVSGTQEKMTVSDVYPFSNERNGNAGYKGFYVQATGLPRQSPTDRFYFDVACCLFEKYNDSVIGQELPEGTGKRFAMCLSGYFQDIIADAGIWRSFVDANRRMYGYSVPFQDDTDEYVDYELNAEDVRFPDVVCNSNVLRGETADLSS